MFQRLRRHYRHRRHRCHRRHSSSTHETSETVEEISNIFTAETTTYHSGVHRSTLRIRVADESVYSEPSSAAARERATRPDTHHQNVDREGHGVHSTRTSSQLMVNEVTEVESPDDPPFHYAETGAPSTSSELASSVGAVPVADLPERSAGLQPRNDYGSHGSRRPYGMIFPQDSRPPWLNYQVSDGDSPSPNRTRERTQSPAETPVSDDIPAADQLTVNDPDAPMSDPDVDNGLCSTCRNPLKLPWYACKGSCGAMFHAHCVHRTTQAGGHDSSCPRCESRSIWPLCPVCLDGVEDKIYCCPEQCDTWFHSDCVEEYVNTLTDLGGPVICPTCRAEWSSESDDRAMCPICYEPMEEASQGLTTCTASCKAQFHEACIDRWVVELQRNSRALTCPKCRDYWLTD
ncbi:uncharacterized protein BO97DRAFT_418049 [Aspergillus homomorphus CBS 101889]|uniref:RING-type domain-containing protein n=1 Tax=Aspergillus homomorphus (strain CBS 101889) TaxID=1450537 RepID=A0A395HKN5_ASPHC|nr:hypothetical protein BO97DRAFT_418049 [Aspergillus homomorphus CBS 101889]RAL08059.1 hypothetical protein BO97DRAFT_418049 [Aspergillus homomorphus CBS 101889]